MKFWKYIVLAGGVAGLVGFFLPFATADNLSLSAFSLLRAADEVEAGVKAEVKDVARTAEEKAKVSSSVSEGFTKFRTLMLLFYAPAAALALIGAFTSVRGRFGRLGGFFALLFGGASAGIWALFHHIAGEPGETATLGIGLHMLLVAGLCGIVAGLGALVTPDRGPEGGSRAMA